MTIWKFFSELTLGGWTSLIVLILSLVEITPIKISPLAWLGKRVNAETDQYIKELDKKFSKLDNKLDEHIAESYRNSILRTQEKLLTGKQMTLEEWKKTLETMDDYEKYCKENNIVNGVVKEATKFIKHEYQLALDNARFIHLPISSNQDGNN